MARQRKPRRNCKNCGKECSLPIKVYCDNKCQLEFQRKENIQKWLAGEIEGGTSDRLAPWAKQYLIDIRGEKCEECGWAERNPYSGNIPIEADHVLSYDNHRPENIKLLCPNCHSLTENYRNLNKGKGRPYRRNSASIA